jgi:hypothetical protein
MVRRQWLKAVLWALLVLAGACLCESLRPRTEEEKVRAVVWKIRRAFLESDFSTIWKLNAAEQRERKPQSEFVQDYQNWVRQDPGWHRHRRRLLQKAEIWEVEIHYLEGVHPYAEVLCRCSPEDSWCLRLWKEEGEWVRWDDYECGWMTLRPSYAPLERKVWAGLPRSSVDPRSVDLVIEIGPSGLDRTEYDALKKVVRPVREQAGDRYVVAVVDASPQVEWGEVIEVNDALMCEEIFDIYYAASVGRQYADTVKVNGTALADIEEGGELADPSGHSAIRRVIGLAAR